MLLAWGWQGSSLLSVCVAIGVFDSLVATAGSRHEASMVEDGDGAAAVADELAFLQAARCHVDADPPDAQHERKKLLRNAKLVGVDAVAGHQQPAGHALCAPTWKRLHAAVCAIWIISKWVKRNNSRRNAALSLKFAAKVRYRSSALPCRRLGPRHETARRALPSAIGKPDHAFRADESDLRSPVAIHGSQH